MFQEITIRLAPAQWRSLVFNRAIHDLGDSDTRREPERALWGIHPI